MFAQGVQILFEQSAADDGMQNIKIDSIKVVPQGLLGVSRRARGGVDGLKFAKADGLRITTWTPFLLLGWCQV